MVIAACAVPCSRTITTTGALWHPLKAASISRRTDPLLRRLDFRGTHRYTSLPVRNHKSGSYLIAVARLTCCRLCSRYSLGPASTFFLYSR